MVNIFTGLQVKKMDLWPEWFHSLNFWRVHSLEPEKTIFILFHIVLGILQLQKNLSHDFRAQVLKQLHAVGPKSLKSQRKFCYQASCLTQSCRCEYIWQLQEVRGWVHTACFSGGCTSPSLQGENRQFSFLTLHCWPPPGLRAPAAVTSYGDTCHSRSRLRPTPGKIPWSNGFHPLPPRTSP